MARRRKNISWGLTQAEQRRNKILAGIGVVSVVALVAAGFAGAAEASKPTTKRRSGISNVSADCNSWQVDDFQLRADLAALVRQSSQKGDLDAFEIAKNYMKLVAPRCTTYPSKTQTPKQAELFVTVFRTLLSVMEEQKLIDTETKNMWTSMMFSWAIAQGVDPVSMG